MDWKDRHKQLTGQKIDLRVKYDGEFKGKPDESIDERLRFLFVLHSNITGYYRVAIASNVKQRAKQISNAAGFGCEIRWKTPTKIKGANEILEDVKSKVQGRVYGDWFDCSWENIEEVLKDNKLI